MVRLIEFELPAAGRLPGGWFAAMDPESARAIRRGKLSFDDVINRQLHEDKVHKGTGKTGFSRTIRVGDRKLNFDDKLDEVEGTIQSMVWVYARANSPSSWGVAPAMGGRVGGKAETAQDFANRFRR